MMRRVVDKVREKMHTARDVAVRMKTLEMVA
jgi:hypothetical protein